MLLKIFKPKNGPCDMILVLYSFVLWKKETACKVGVCHWTKVWEVTYISKISWQSYHTRKFSSNYKIEQIFSQHETQLKRSSLVPVANFKEDGQVWARHCKIFWLPAKKLNILAYFILFAYEIFVWKQLRCHNKRKYSMVRDIFHLSDKPTRPFRE